MSSTVSPLFQSLHVGAVNVQHRVVMAPLTRFRADKAHVHGDLAKTYYEQRASVPGTLIVSEGTFIAPQAGGYGNAPSIWSDAQIAGWKTVRTFWCFAVIGYADLKTRSPMPCTLGDRLSSSNYGHWVALPTRPSSSRKATLT
jgi:hypothetical protein